MRNEYQSSPSMIGLHTAPSLPGDGNVQQDTVPGHILEGVATEGTNLNETSVTASKAAESDNGFSPSIGGPL
jgi:hypothetical protein